MGNPEKVSKEKIHSLILRIKTLGEKADVECEQQLSAALEELKTVQTKIAAICSNQKKYNEERRQLEMELRTTMVHYVNQDPGLTLPDDEILIEAKGDKSILMDQQVS